MEKPLVFTRREILRAALGAAVASCAGPARILAQRGYDFGDVRAQIIAHAERTRTAVAIALAHRGSIVWEEGFGWADRERRVKATARTPFCLASISKTFTATALMSLVDAGMLRINDPANHYLPMPLAGFDDDARGVTIRQLGAHASGLPSLFEMHPLEGRMKPSGYEALPPQFLRLAYRPGETYEYSNIAYSALGAIAERVTGNSFAEVLQSRVFSALSLNDSFFGETSPRTASAAKRYDELGNTIPAYATATPPSGEVYASAHDVVRFALFHLKHRIATRASLSDRGIDAMAQPVLRGPGGGGTTFGWFTGRTRRGLSVLFKDGGQPGVSTVLYVVPSEHLACVVLTNRSDPDGWAQNAADAIVASVIPSWTQPDTSPAAPPSQMSSRSVFAGSWSGVGTGGRSKVAIHLDANDSAVALMTAGNYGAERATVAQQGKYFVATARSNETRIALKVERRKGTLTGRMLCTSQQPGFLRIEPYVVRLERR